MFTDIKVMPGGVSHLSTDALRKRAAELEAGQAPGTAERFSTALTDAERQYLDVCAELYARGEYAGGRKQCSESQLAEWDAAMEYHSRRMFLARLLPGPVLGS